jgi:hypothetical protein
MGGPRRERVASPAGRRAEMAGRMPEHGNEILWTYDDQGSAVMAFLLALLIDAGIIGLFLFITWLTYATD